MLWLRKVHNIDVIKTSANRLLLRRSSRCFSNFRPLLLRSSSCDIRGEKFFRSTSTYGTRRFRTCQQHQSCMTAKKNEPNAQRIAEYEYIYRAYSSVLVIISSTKSIATLVSKIWILWYKFRLELGNIKWFWNLEWFLLGPVLQVWECNNTLKDIEGKWWGMLIVIQILRTLSLIWVIFYHAHISHDMLHFQQWKNLIIYCSYV